jgi:hypothetical protein
MHTIGLENTQPHRIDAILQFKTRRPCTITTSTLWSFTSDHLTLSLTLSSMPEHMEGSMMRYWSALTISCLHLCNASLSDCIRWLVKPSGSGKQARKIRRSASEQAIETSKAIEQARQCKHASEQASKRASKRSVGGWVGQSNGRTKRMPKWATNCIS